MTPTAHICIIFSILGNWMNILVAFMNKEASKVGVNLGDSSTTTTTATATVATTEVTK
jgi:ABC-type sugar transport system substrate-binding protein